MAGLRALTFAALAALTAAVAHGGFTTLADPRWAIAALSGAGVAALIPAMLAAQTAAHLALLAAGAPAHPGAHGSLALHLALAVVAAVLVQLIDVHTQRRALKALTAPRLSEHVVRRAPAAAASRGLAGWHRRDRAPPLPA